MIPFWLCDDDSDYDPMDSGAVLDAEQEWEEKEASKLAAIEEKRQERIAAGIEHACVVCGCSESLACPGGCVWATPNLCSRCARKARDAYYGG